MTTITSKRRRVRRSRRPQLPSQIPSTVQPFSVYREVALYAALIILSVLMHVWRLGNMAMHHDESIHAQFSWEFFTGNGQFPCWSPDESAAITADTYCYNPVYHGPVLYLTTYLSYFLFGVSDATARLPMAVAGVLLVASCWMLRPLVGRRTALLTAGLMLFSPSLLYFTRFARHDALAVLFTFWIFVGAFRFWHEREQWLTVQHGERPRQSGKWLYLSAASLALLWATHELVFIIIFILVTFVVSRLIWELFGQRFFVIASGVLMFLCALMIVFSTPIHIPVKPTDQPANVLHLGGFGMLGLLTLLVGQLVSLRWSEQRVLVPLIVKFNQRDTNRLILGTVAAFVIPFVITFSTFFTYPKGVLDGLYAGLAYWLGSQQSFARGDQPWYYYFMQLGIYEILPITLMLVGFGAWLFKALSKRSTILSRLWDEEEVVEPLPPVNPTPSPVVNPQLTLNEEGDWETMAPAETLPVEIVALDVSDTHPTQSNRLPFIPYTPVVPTETISNLWVGFGFYWFLLALVVFSWAGEKMPWLTIHMTLPAVVAGAWALNRIIEAVPWKQGETSRYAAVIALSALGLVMFITATGFFGTDSSQTALQERINGLFLLLLIVGVGVVIWLIGTRLGWRSTSRLVGLGVLSILTLYSIRAQALVVYDHPDVPIELLVYTQTSPDVPIMVDTINEIAIAQTRIARSTEDPTGGKSMNILLSSGLEQPFAWYLRGWKNLQWRSAEQIAALTDADLQAPVAIFSSEHLGEGVVDKLKQAGYIEVYRSYQNWWFPEGGNLGGGGYKNRLYDPDYGCDANLRGQSDENGRAAWDCTLGAVEVLTWPLRISNWHVLRNYMLFREFPEGTQPGGREIVMFARQSASPTLGNVAGGAGTGGAPILRLASEGPLSGNIAQQARGIATGPDGSVYVADAQANLVLIYEVSGETRIITGEGENTLYEPSSVAVDSQGNLYVTDTWHARIVKFDKNDKFVTAWGVGEQVLDPATQKKYTPVKTPEEAQAKPLGFFGPRGIAVDDAGHVYIADTGNKRIVVTSDTGEYVGQIGSEGAAAGQFNEPIGVAVMNGQLFVGDTWNGRIQVFPIDGNGVPLPTPNTTWKVDGWATATYLDPFIAVNPQGQVVVSVPSQNRAILYDNTGKALLVWGGNGEPDVSMSGPSGVSFAPDGSVYVAEKGTGQVQRWVLPKLR